MELSLIALAGFAILFIILSILFLAPLIEITVNGIILFLLFIRIHTELTKYRRGNLYLKAGIGAAIIMLLLGNIIAPLWRLTTWTIITFAIAHVTLALTK